MRALWSWLEWLLGFVWCRHLNCYRERRAGDGLGLLHLVCPRCGYAAPMVNRTPAELRALFAGRGLWRRNG